MALWILVSFTALGIVFAALGWRWDTQRHKVRPATPKQWPKVSILIAAYKSADTIVETLASLRRVDYPNLETIVVNDSPGDGTQTICKRYGVSYLENATRQGKSAALNMASKKAKGDIFFFVDADTTVEPDAIKKLVPWFAKADVAAVQPKYTLKQKTSWLSHLISLEHAFIASFFKIHMFFGSLISFRGCGVAIRASTFRDMGGWPHTLVEDVDFSVALVSKGHKIWFEPDAHIKTEEPATVKELFRQRARWGEGSLFTFIRYWRTYAKNIQFHTYFLPYALLALAGIGIFFYQSTLALLPAASLYFLYTFSVREFLVLSSLLILPILTSMITTTATTTVAASAAHVSILAYPERRQQVGGLVLSIPYVLLFFPMLMLFYSRGVLRGIQAKRKGRTEIDFKNW
ncbi:MAG: glycosyltransferase family 2 protein [Nanoarchaeota archaeon]|nr:glycosyltransferase family 2 protein [Nanoarchaeota archaeon]